MEDWQDDENSDESSLISDPPNCTAEIKHERVIIHVDIDCFYAQVETILNPSLRGKPLGIQQKSIVVTCNYEARAKGVKKLMLIKDAKQVCPELVLVNGEDLKKYREASDNIYRVLRSFCPLVEKLCLDENFIDATEKINSSLITEETLAGHTFQPVDKENCSCGCKQRLILGSRLAQEMRDRLHQELGITSCAGVAHNKLLAKLAGALNKPNQQTTVFPSSGLTLIESLSSPRNFPGIGSSTFKKLEELDIHTVSQLQTADIRRLDRVFGEKAARHIQQLSLGIDESRVKITDRPKSIGAEDGFPAVRTSAEVRDKMKLLLARVWDLVEKDGRYPSQMKLTVRKVVQGQPGIRESRQTSLDMLGSRPATTLNPSQEGKLVTALMQLFEKMVAGTSWQVNILGISFAGLTERVSSDKNSIQKFFASSSSKAEAKSTASSSAEPPAKRTRMETVDETGTAAAQRFVCPEGVDPLVFSQLPPDIQEELMASHAPKARNPQPKNQSKKSSQNLFKYFKKV